MKKTKLLAGALSGIMAAAMAASAMTASADELKLGDPTGDGIIDSIDASYILSLYADLSVNGEEITDEILEICDVDKDGKVNSLDASLILSYYANQSIADTEVSLEAFIEEICNKAVSWWDENAKDLVYDPTSSLSWYDTFSEDIPWGKWDPDSNTWSESGLWDNEALWGPWQLWYTNPSALIDGELSDTEITDAPGSASSSPWIWGSSYNPWGSLWSLSDENGQAVTTEETTSDDGYAGSMDSRYCLWIDIAENKDYVFNDDFIEVCFKLKDNIPEKDYPVRFITDFSTVNGNSLVPDKVIQGNIRVGGSIEAQDVSSETGFVAYGDNVSANPGEEVRYRINLKNNPGMAGMLVWVYYNSNAMEVEKITPSGEFAELADTVVTGEKPKN